MDLGFIALNHVGFYLVVLSLTAGPAGFVGTVFLFNADSDSGTPVPLSIAPGASGFFAIRKFAFPSTPGDSTKGTIDLTFNASVASSSINYAIQYLG